MVSTVNTSKRTMIEILLAFAVGILVGIIFSACKLPVPAPPALAGVVGIAGIYLGAHAWPLLSRIFS